MAGKLCQVGPLEYTPSGRAILYATLAVKQGFLDRKGFGYVELMAEGELATKFSEFSIGAKVKIEGSLWTRRFRDRQMRTINETKVVLKSILEMEVT